MSKLFRFTSLVILSQSLVATVATAQNRQPSAACKFDINALTVFSGSPMGEVVDEAKKKITGSLPEIKDFSHGIPVTVRLDAAYAMQGCKKQLKARMTMTPAPLNGAKKAPKAWVTRNVELKNLPDQGKFSVDDIAILDFFEALTPETVPDTLTFELVIFEDGREVAAKSTTIDSTAKGD
ncbi:MAG TPA: hypothetical protein VM901_06100 [Bdellovibrionota bacterium]|nr:hypothetical protein [Bdellovibrionota bacterium]